MRQIMTGMQSRVQLGAPVLPAIKTPRLVSPDLFRFHLRRPKKQTGQRTYRRRDFALARGYLVGCAAGVGDVSPAPRFSSRI